MYDESSEAMFRHKARAKSWAYDTSGHDLRVLPVYFMSDALSSDALSPSPSSGYQSTSSSASGQVTSSSSSQPPQMFHCPEHDCFRKFNRRYTLIEHLKIHTGEKPHVCPAAGCRKRFTTSGNLSRHKRLHGFIQPLECPVDGCMSTFPSNNKLEKHMKYHLGSPVHVCKIGTCGKTFSTMGNLNRHVKHHHNLEVHENDTESSSRGSFSGANSISSSSSTRGSFASEFHFQSPTAADDDVYYANNTPRGKPGGGQSIIRSPAPLSSTMGSGNTGIPFPRIYPASVHVNGNPERVWSSETLLDSLSTIFDEDEPQQQQHHSVPQHHHESLQYQHHNQQQQRQQYHQYLPMQPPSFPASPTLLDDMIHFHVTNFQC